MSLSKYPEMLDLFQVKKDAAFDGDPNGDDVMADDINSLQDAISAIESTLGVKPQGSKLNVGERISLLEGSAALRVPSFLMYLGESDKINGATSVDEAVSHFVKFDHIVLGNNADDITSESHSVTQDVMTSIKGNRDIKIYGYIDCGANTANLSISQIQVKIQSWKSMGADGIYCDNFGYESGVSRDTQNQILDSIHQYGMVAILQAADSEKVLTNAFDASMNPNWTAPHIQEGDVYHYQQFAVDTSTSDIYTDTYALVDKMNNLYTHRLALGINVFATPYIASSTNTTLAQQYYEWAHVAALLTSVDAFYPVIEGNAKLNNLAPSYNWIPIAGNWYVNKPIININTGTNTFSRETAFGKVTMNNAAHTYEYEGIYIPFELLKIAANSIDGSLLVDGSIEDKKIKSYDGQRLISSINADTSTNTIDIKKIATFGYGDISGDVPTDVLKTNVIDAINAHIGTAKIDQAFIGDLNANKITAGDIDAGRISANVVNALNLYAQNMTVGSAKIGEAVIGDLHADKITAGDIDAARLTANVVSAININAQGAEIQNLHADNITAGDIASDRIKTNVINAINAYAQQMVVGSAVINSATIGALTAQHIQAAVINAINTTTDTAVINNARIGSLSVDNMKAAVVEAINLQATTAQIDQARIGNLDASKITSGSIDTDRLTASVLSAINASIENATINQAKIGNLSADKITAGDISADRISTNVVNAINAYAQNMTAQSAKINIATVGEMDAQHIQAAVIDAINMNTENATIANAKIGNLSVDNMKASVISAINATLESASIDQAHIGNLDASKITTGDLSADRIKAGVISAINASLDTATIGAAKIGSLEVDNMKAAVIEAVNASLETATIDSAKIGSLSVDNMKANIVDAVNAYVGAATIDKAHIGALDANHITAAVVDAINASIGTATINSAKIGQLSVDNMKGTVVEAINSYTGTAVIGEGMIGNLSADKITSGDISSDRIAANVLAAINAKLTTATIDSAVIGSLTTDNIKSTVVDAINLYTGTATIDSAKIGTLAVQNMSANIISAINASLETATIGAAKIANLDAAHIQAVVIDAINTTTQTAVIGAAKIGNLDASKITTGNIDASRMTTNVLSAINADVSSATINSAKIGVLTADKIQANVISAINFNAGTATINQAVIPTLSSDHISASVIDAINANISGSAKINSAVIGTLSSDIMQTNIITAINANIGTATIDQAVIPNLDAGHIAASVVEAINMKSTTTQIDQARIGVLDAGKIQTGDISADRIKTNVVAAINADLSTATIGSAKIGSLSASNIQASVISAINASVENATIDSAKVGAMDVNHLKASVIEAINASIENVTINSAMIGTLSADKMSANVIQAVNANIGTATIDKAIIPNLDASKITTGSIAANLMTANVIQSINADLTTATIVAGKIGTLTVDNMSANIIAAVNASVENATIGAAKIGSLSVDNMKANVISAINGTLESAAIGAAHIGNLDASKITSGSIATGLLTANVVSAINADVQTAQIAEAKIADLHATKIVAGDIDAARMTANVVSAINTYTQNMNAGSAHIDSAIISTLSADQMQAKVISAINASIETINGTNATINNAKIGTLTADHIQASVIDAINTTTQTAVIDQAKIGNLDASKITTGSISADRMTTNVISAINADLTSAVIGGAKIGTLDAGHIEAQVIEAINTTTDTATINSAKIGTLTADHIDTVVISAINASLESAVINQAKIAALDADHIKASVITAINESVENITISNAKIANLNADQIKAVVIDAINTTTQTATIGAARIGVLTASNIGAGTISADKISVAGLDASQITSGYISANRLSSGIITSDLIHAGSIQTSHMSAGSINGDRIQAGTLNADRLVAGTLDASFIKAGTITSELIAAGGITARNIAAYSITADMIQAGSITADKISTKGLDAQNIQVYNGKTGEVLIGGGYLRVDGLDVGVVQSDNLIGNGAFITASSSYGYLRDNPSDEAMLGGQATVAGGHQLWKISLTDGTVHPIDLGGKKPYDFAIDTTGTYGYVTMQGDDTLVQIDLANNARTGAIENLGKGPGKIYFAGDELDDHKHMLVLNQDPEDVNIPDSLTVVDVPPTSINQSMYNHHFVPLGDTPWDIVTNDSHQTFITLAKQGDIAWISMANLDSIHWQVIKNISIAAYETDNYHGGLPGQFGLGFVTGGDSSSQFNTGMTDMSTTGMDPHGGYGVTDGSLITYEPHGIALSADPDHLYVADYANGYLILVDKEGKAPYNGLTGSRETGNMGSMGIPQGMGPNTPQSSDSPDGNPEVFPAPIYPQSVGEPEIFTTMAMDMNMGTSQTVTTSGGRTFTTDQTQHTTRYVRYRIPVGNSPEDVVVGNGYVFVSVEGDGQIAFIKEQDIINEIVDDRNYYQGWDVFTDMKPLPMWTVGHINVGSKPAHMVFDKNTKRLYVSVNGQNQVVVIDTTAINPANPDASIVQRINTGANPKGLGVDANSQYLYVVNHGGSGNLSFVYPSGDYIGDPYVGLEGGVEYQGADFWVPNRSEWVKDTNGNIVSGSAVEFHINEPFLNEGGYVKLTAYNDGSDAQWATIEQDIVNVTNYSNGNNIVHVTGETLNNNGTYTIFTPANPWLNPPGVSNVKIKGISKAETLTRQSDNVTFTAAHKWESDPQPPTFQKVLADGTTLAVDPSTYTITYPTTDADIAKIVFNSAVETGANIIAIQYYWWQTATGYTVEYNTGAYIQFPLGQIPQDGSQWIVADYTAKYNMWFKAHNGSIEVAVEQGATDNFYPKFEIDEFVPKFVTYDNQTTNPFTYTPVAVQGTNDQYNGIYYSVFQNRAGGKTVTSSAAPTTGTLAMIVDEMEPDALPGDVTANPAPMSSTTTLPSGLQSVTIDLGAVYMIGKISVAHSYGLDRTYHQTKTEVSEDGVTWTTIYDSAVSGEYNEKPIYHSAHMHTHYAHFFTFNNKRVRYIRDWANGWTSGDGTTSGTTNDWTEIRAYGDWEYETEYLNPDGTQMASNGKGLVTTDINGAYASIDLTIDFTSKWYMTYIIGPEFGMAEVEMSSMMGMTHSLIMEAPTLSKFQHKHIMYWPPSSNVKDDPSTGVIAGHHRARIIQKSGKISIDTFRFEDFQYFDRNSQAITPDKTATFRRTKIVPTQAQWYVGDAIQSSEGAYNSPRLNPDTNQPDYSVAIKYRMRFRVDLSQGAQKQDGTYQPGHGIAYATSAIFETGKLSTHWRRSESSDKVPGVQIEPWDGNNPGKTGIQNYHLANGAVRGNKISPLAIMDHHINAYAKISESKLKLNHPTHRHGQVILAPSPTEANAQIEVGFVSNEDTLNSITGWGTSGTSTNMARADHTHDSSYLAKNADGSVSNLSVAGDITVSGNVDGVKVSTLGSNFSTHIADAVAHLSSAEHTKLTGISTGATKTQSSATNGHITIDGADTTVYAHPSGDGNLHVPATSTTNNGKVLMAGSTAGSLSWTQLQFSNILSTSTITNTQHGAQTDGTLHANASQTVNGFMSYQDKVKMDGISTGANKVVHSNTNGNVLIDGTDTVVYAHPSGDGNLHVPANGTTHQNHVLKAGATAGVYSWAPVQWTEISGTFSDALHGNLDGGSLHAVATGSVNGFMSAADKLKLDGIQSSAINQTTADGRYVQLSGGTMTGNLTIDNVKANSGIEIGDSSGVQETPYIDFHSSGAANNYDSRISASGGTSGTDGAGTITVNAATFDVEGNITLSGTVDGVDVSTFKASFDTHTKVPNPATSLALSESGTQVNVQFNLSTSAEATEYEIWSSFGDTSHYQIIGIVNKADIGSSVTTYTFIDSGYSRKGTIYYRIYAKNGSVRSTSLEGNIALAHTVADPTGLNVVANVDSFDIYYTLPNDRLLDHVEIRIDKQAVAANLSEANAVLVYSGLADRFTYKIASPDYSDFFNVYVKSVTRS